MKIYIEGKEAHIGTKVKSCDGRDLTLEGWQGPSEQYPFGRILLRDDIERSYMVPANEYGASFDKGYVINFELNVNEISFLKLFEQKQKNGSRDNAGTVDAIHVVEKNNKEWVLDESAETWVDGSDEYKEYDSFGALIDARIENGEELPRYEEVLYERVNDIFITTAADYIKAYEIDDAYCGRWIDNYRPVAFFFVLEEARRYKDDYQKHNCDNCRIYTYSLGYANKGDLPVFRDMLLRMGEQLNEKDYEKRM